jgi:uncharacterized membrane protein YraQ (UPF0718 family)
MKKLIKEAIIYILLGLIIWGIVALFSFGKSLSVAKVAYKAFAGAFWIIISVFIFIGLIQAWVTPEQLSKYLGKTAGWKRFAFASTVPIFLGGSLFTIFPLTKSLKEKGASNSAILTFITAWSGKAPLIPLEANFLGWKFTILRTLLIIPTAIVMGFLGETILDKWEGVPVAINLNKMATGEVLVAEELTKALEEEDKAQAEADKIISQALHCVEFTIVGDILEKNIPLKLAELSSQYGYNMVKLKIDTPSVRLSTDKKCPSRAKFILASKTSEHIPTHLNKVYDLLKENDIVVVEKKKLSRIQLLRKS